MKPRATVLVCRCAGMAAVLLLTLCGPAVAALADPGFPPAGVQAASGDADPMAVLQRAKMWHIAHDTEAELKQYADDAVVTLSPAPPAPGRASYDGRAQVREYLEWSRQQTGAVHEQLCCSSVEQHGDTVTMTSRMTSDLLRSDGYDWVPVIDSFVVRGGLIARYSMTELLDARPAVPIAQSVLPDARLMVGVLGASVLAGLGAVSLLRRLTSVS